MGSLSPVHLIIILVIALLILGPGKLPETGAALGKAIREFRQAVDAKAESTAAPSEDTGGVNAPSTPTGPSAPDGPVGDSSSGTDPA
jgi:sec-independent protein translocase protein TatA